MLGIAKAAEAIAKQLPDMFRALALTILAIVILILVSHFVFDRSKDHVPAPVPTVLRAPPLPSDHHAEDSEEAKRTERKVRLQECVNKAKLVLDEVIPSMRDLVLFNERIDGIDHTLEAQFTKDFYPVGKYLTPDVPHLPAIGTALAKVAVGVRQSSCALGAAGRARCRPDEQEDKRRMETRGLNSR
ncbi:hypothetical protein [Sorangium sp. So ce861]|uniref:hypothetical protein n=1 Tax=Sorangium sp. So ce861 TaxID=3133323 RepID=UPI003F6112A0